MTLSDTRTDRHLTAPLRPQPSPDTGLPQLPGPPFQRAVPNTPMGQNGCFCRLLPRSTRAFPVSQAGRRPSLHFRGLLRLHSRYGLLDCSTAHGGLCHEASVQPVARLNRSSATRSYRQLPGWILPPLVNRAVGAHCESRATPARRPPLPCRPRPGPQSSGRARRTLRLCDALRPARRHRPSPPLLVCRSTGVTPNPQDAARHRRHPRHAAAASGAPTPEFRT
jgi:hypothetical protein